MDRQETPQPALCGIDLPGLWFFRQPVSASLATPHSGELIENAHCFAVRVYIEDTDLGGVVYHANYLRFLERARSDLLRALGIDQRAAMESGDGVYAVIEMQIRFRRPARLQDDLLITSQIEEIGGASAVLSQNIRRGEERIAEARVTLAFLGPNGHPKRQPTEWVRRFEQLRAGGIKA